MLYGLLTAPASVSPWLPQVLLYPLFTLYTPALPYLHLCTPVINVYTPYLSTYTLTGIGVIMVTPGATDTRFATRGSATDALVFNMPLTHQTRYSVQC